MAERQSVLSVVAASRNDEHGIHLLARTRAFINGLADQVERFRRPVELLLVEWNPPKGVLPLAEVLDCPPVAGFEFRIIPVPHHVHALLPASDRLPFYQMIAKNVGIRRATGRAVLATNVDILLSDQLFLDSTAPLRDNCVYRTDRVDVPFDPTEAANPRALRESEPIRFNRKDGIHYPQEGRLYPHVRGVRDLSSVFLRDPVGFFRRAVRWSENSGPPSLQRYRRAFLQILVLPRLPLNACGDFTLMTRASWERLGGYPEWDMFSWNLDSLLLYQAAALGFGFVEYTSPAFHLDHSAGWSPESHRALFDRLKLQGIPLMTDADLLDVAAELWRRRRQAGPRRINTCAWGYPDHDFAEARLSGT